MATLLWYGNCVTCGAPLDPMLMCDNHKFFKFIDKQIDMKIFDNNSKRYKFFGRTARKVCKACFHNYYTMKTSKNIKNIELGNFPRLKCSLSQTDTRDWFDVLEESWNTFINAPCF